MNIEWLIDHPKLDELMFKIIITVHPFIKYNIKSTRTFTESGLYFARLCLDQRQLIGPIMSLPISFTCSNKHNYNGIRP